MEHGAILPNCPHLSYLVKRDLANTQSDEALISWEEFFDVEGLCPVQLFVSRNHKHVPNFLLLLLVYL